MTKSDPAQKHVSPEANDVPPPNADSVLASASKATKKGPPPVHLWNPPFCGNLDMRIARDGTWFYEGTPITRPALVKMFASILRKDDDAYFLVTPVEKVGITVEDAPFIATDFERAGDGPEQSITFTTNMGDQVTAGPEAPLRIARNPQTGEPAPYVTVRRNLEARIDRKSFYRLVELCAPRTQDGVEQFGLSSQGAFFAFAEMEELV
ncbi:MAG: DUF1285 domain-containing protein [Mangrovicoccus sp.]|nr:DUF1285 domain-containing protein [Mangrovicoccus sp.]